MTEPNQKNPRKYNLQHVESVGQDCLCSACLFLRQYPHLKRTDNDWKDYLPQPEPKLLPSCDGGQQRGLRSQEGVRRSISDETWGNLHLSAVDRTGQVKAGSAGVDRRISATAIILDSIAKQRGIPDPLEFGILDNSQNKPEYSPAVTYLIGAVIAVLMLAGVALVFVGVQ